jgi:tetratricopeptide (TPR) repeat protein
MTDKIKNQFNVGGDYIENQTIIYGKRQINRFLTSPPFDPPMFVGRNKELETVHAKLTDGQNFLMLVNGQGGIGKTSFAAKYWRKYQDEYSHLAFLFVENGIANALLSLAYKLGLEFTTETLTEQLEMLVAAVAGLKKPCLLVLDNANSEQDLKENVVALRKCSNFHILVTSRLDKFAEAERHKIGALADEDALTVFKEHYKHLEDAELPLFYQVFEAIGGNTLVLELLAKNLANLNSELRKKYSLQNLVDDLQKGLTKLSKSQEVTTAYRAKGTGLRQETPEAIILAMYDLTELAESEKALLSIFAVLPAENIEFATLEKLLEAKNLDTTLLALAQKGWLEQNAASFKISPLVQEITHHKNQDRLLADCEKLIDRLNDSLNYGENPEIFHRENYQSTSLYQRYAEGVLANLASFENQLGSNFLMLCERIGTFYGTTGNLRQALHFHEKYEALAKKLVAQRPDNPDLKNGLAISYGKLGTTQASLGNLSQALAFYEQYHRLEKELHQAYPDNVEFKNGLAISYERLGETHTNLGDLSQALGFFEQYHQLEKELHRAYPDNVEFKNNLAISCQFLGHIQALLGDLAQALGFYEQYNQLEKELHEAYPDHVSFKNLLAISYEKLGNTQADLRDLPQALGFYEQCNQLGRELHQAYPDNVGFKNNLAISYQYLGITYASLGDLPQALTFYEQYNQLAEELHQAYPDTVEFKSNLAVSYLYLGKTQASLGNLLQALRFYEQYNQLKKNSTKLAPET